jgi:hypothetical protein
MKKSKLLLLLYFRNAKRAWVSSDGVRYPKREEDDGDCDDICGCIFGDGGICC